VRMTIMMDTGGGGIDMASDNGVTPVTGPIAIAVPGATKVSKRPGRVVAGAIRATPQVEPPEQRC